jgi:serine/threonine-protein kinase
VLLGLASAAWAAFLWYELYVSHTGGSVVCLGGNHCVELWDSPFASAVHRASGMPIAGWGVAWGVCAFVLPYLALRRVRAAEPAAVWLAATRCTALAGAVTVLVLLAVSYFVGEVCSSCLATYSLVGGYVFLVAMTLSARLGAELAGGALRALGVLFVSLPLLLIIGRRTPVESVLAGQPLPQAPVTAGDTPDDRELVRFIQTLPAQQKQLLSDTLAAYAAASVWELPPARTVIGPSQARLQLTEFSDMLCSHCAQFHELMLQLRQRFGEDVLSLAPHQYPLDSACNSFMSGEESNPLRCLAARVQICLEGKPGSFELTGELFQRQSELNEGLLKQLATKLMPEAELDACLTSPDTEKKLQADIQYAGGHKVMGTPLLLVGGRPAIPFPQLLYVLALTRGAASHPAFALLPPPQPLPFPHPS